MFGAPNIPCSRVLKNKLSFFPPLNDIFELLDGDSSKDVILESYPCTCRGSDRPHEHYFISWEGLEAGDKIEITKNSADQYFLNINKS